ncbi:MAG TPA: hypothetical protein ENN20_07500 [Candidatus Marinimicrobia bacterium]|mgnify:CR=1 FL=1|nr:hypothetical protein [Candidatus Neomarinimicrobiota bacterium]
MKKILFICLLLGFCEASLSQSSSLSSKEQYLKETIKLIDQNSPKKNYIKILTEDGIEIEGRFFALEGDNLVFQSYQNQDKQRIPLREIKLIMTENNICVYMKRDFEKKYGFKEHNQNDSLKIQITNDIETLSVEDITTDREEISLLRRQTVAQERIALVATYFMILSVTSIVISILIIL